MPAALGLVRPSVDTESRARGRDNGRYQLALAGHPNMSQEDIDMLASEETISRLAPAVLDVAISSTLEGGHVIKASPGRLYSLTVRIDSTLASGTYYLQLHNCAGVASEGAHAFLEAPTKVQHEQSYDDYVSKDSSRGGAYASLGIYACISSTEFTKTLVSSAASFSAEYA